MSASRQELMEKWLGQLAATPLDLSSIQPASSDASFRRYFRVKSRAGDSTFVVMDAPPDKENVLPFIEVAGVLAQAGVKAPAILAKSVEQGFLLLDDFGSRTFLSVLGGGGEEADEKAHAMYRCALSDLVHMQANADTQTLPAYSPEKLRSEMDLFDEWFVGRHFGNALTDEEKNHLERIKASLVASATAEAQVFVHRDYHSRNLMVLGSESDPLKLGMLDFQDAVRGPLSYDVVSLLRDAYVEWPEDLTLDWAIRYWEMARKAGLAVPEDPSEFYRQFDFMGMQRHLKVLGIFARLFHRDGKDQYLNDLPLVLAYVRSVAHRYIAFKPLLLILDRLENRAVQVGYTF